MAKVKLNAALTHLSGTIEHWVYRQTPDGTIVSPRAKRKQPWSHKQKAHRVKMSQEAAELYHAEMRDPAKNATHRLHAKAQGSPVSAYVMGGYMKRGTRFAELHATDSPLDSELSGRDGSDCD